jgi:hypothetical protein
MANRKISDLTALTTPATGDLLPIVDISEAAAADKNKKITFGELFASIPAGTAAAPSIAFEGDSNTGIYSPGADTIAFVEGGAEAARIDSSARLLVGTTSSTGSTSNTAPVVAGLFKSFNGTISSAADETAYTAFAAPNVNATYIVTARVPSTEAATVYEEVAIVSANSGSSVSLDIAILKNGSLMTISLSGANVQVKQASGVAQTINWSAVCIG